MLLTHLGHLEPYPMNLKAVSADAVSPTMATSPFELVTCFLVGDRINIGFFEDKMQSNKTKKDPATVLIGWLVSGSACGLGFWLRPEPSLLRLA